MEPTNRSAAVDQFMSQLDHPMKAEIETIRAIILTFDAEITEHIKWNAPSFCYQGDDRVTFRLHPQKGIQLIFHRGAKVKDSQNFAFQDDSGLLEWVAKDRAVVTFVDMQAVDANKSALSSLVRRWMSSTG